MIASHHHRASLSRHRDENPVTATPLESALTNCDASKPFRFRFYENCRVSLSSLIRSTFKSELHRNCGAQVPTRSGPANISTCFDLSPFLSHSSALFCAFLHFLALTQNSTLFFSSNSTLFRKNKRGWGTPPVRFFLFQLLFRAKIGFPNPLFSIRYALFQVPYPASPLFAAHTKTTANSSHSGTPHLPPDSRPFSTPALTRAILKAQP